MLLAASLRADTVGHFLWIGSDSWGAKIHPVPTVFFHHLSHFSSTTPFVSSVRSSSVYQGLIEIQILQILKCLDPTCAIFLKSWWFTDINHINHIIKHDVGASQGPLDTIFKEEVRKV